MAKKQAWYCIMEIGRSRQKQKLRFKMFSFEFCKNSFAIQLYVYVYLGRNTDSHFILFSQPFDQSWRSKAKDGMPFVATSNSRHRLHRETASKESGSPPSPQQLYLTTSTTPKRFASGYGSTTTTSTAWSMERASTLWGGHSYLVRIRQILGISPYTFNTSISLIL